MAETIGQHIYDLKQQKLEVTRSIYNFYKTYDYDNQELFKIDVDFILGLYGIALTEPKKVRTEQEKFREALINKYGNCILTNNDPVECDACHIIPLTEGENYDVDNGLLMSKSLHKLFDENYWCICPLINNQPINNQPINNQPINNQLTNAVLKVVINKKKLGNKKLSCSAYDGVILPIKTNSTLLSNLKKRYEMYLLHT
jgi:hypothetical protein